MLTKFYVDECPKAVKMFDWIRQHSHFDEAARDVRPAIGDAKHIFMDYQWDIRQMEASVREAERQFPPRGWVNGQGKHPTYSGLSLVYNPWHEDNLDPLSSTLGSPNVTHGTYGSETYQSMGRDSYYDTLGFCYRTEPSRVGELGRLLDSIELSGFTMVRGRIAILDASEGKGGVIMHRDETVFENMRINVPVYGYTDPYTWGFEMEGYEPYPFQLGRAYSWDTNIPHAPMAFKRSFETRANLVIGVSPWLRFLPQERAWEFNEHFGKRHPFDLLSENMVSPAFRFDTSF